LKQPSFLRGLCILAIFAWAGWAKLGVSPAGRRPPPRFGARGVLVPDANGAPSTSRLHRQARTAFALEIQRQKSLLADYKGKASSSISGYWWACKIETPWIIELREKYARRDLKSSHRHRGRRLKKDDKAPGKDKAAVAKFVERKRITYPILVDGDSLSQE